jgi:glycerophosphoryl diester phosphodiesterase
LFRAGRPEDFSRWSPRASETAPSQRHPNLGFWLDVRLTGDGNLFVSHHELLKSGPAAGKPIELATKAECQAAGLFELTEFTVSMSNRPTVINLISRRPGLALRFLEKWGTEENKIPLRSTVAQSESDGTLKELREAQPRGLFGSSQAVLIQLEILSALELQGLAELKSDILISDIEERRISDHQDKKNLAPFQPRLRLATLVESKRRGLKRYAGPTSELSTAESMFKNGYDGVLTDSVEVVQQYFISLR